MNARALGLAGLTLLLTGCAHPELKRFATDTTFDDSKVAALGDGQPKLDVYAYSPPTPPTPKPAPTTLKDLSDRAQAAAVTAATGADPKLDALTALAARPFEAKPDEAASTPAVVGSTLERTLVINIAKGLTARPGDRITWTEVRIEPTAVVRNGVAEPAFEFAGYSVAATDTKVINVATLENTTTTSVKASVAPNLLADVKGTGLLEGTFGSTKKATAAVEDTVVGLDVGIRPRLLRVTRESGRNGEVVGNTFVALSLDLAGAMNGPGSLNGLLVKKQELTKDNAFVAAADAKVKVAMAQYPPACDLKANATLIYQLRAITAGKGDRSYVEGDDVATYVRDYKSEEVVLVRGVDVRPRLWAVYADARDGAGNAVPVYVEARTPFDEFGPLLFSSYSDAHLFATWLARAPSAAAGPLSLFWNRAPVGAGTPTPYARIVKPLCPSAAALAPGGGGVGAP